MAQDWESTCAGKPSIETLPRKVKVSGCHRPPGDFGCPHRHFKPRPRAFLPPARDSYPQMGRSMFPLGTSGDNHGRLQLLLVSSLSLEEEGRFKGRLSQAPGLSHNRGVCAHVAGEPASQIAPCLR
jgi:hypothetical protein